MGKSGKKPAPPLPPPFIDHTVMIGERYVQIKYAVATIFQSWTGIVQGAYPVDKKAAVRVSCCMHIDDHTYDCCHYHMAIARWLTNTSLLWR